MPKWLVASWPTSLRRLTTSGSDANQWKLALQPTYDGWETQGRSPLSDFERREWEHARFVAQLRRIATGKGTDGEPTEAEIAQALGEEREWDRRYLRRARTRFAIRAVIRALLLPLALIYGALRVLFDFYSEPQRSQRHVDRAYRYTGTIPWILRPVFERPVDALRVGASLTRVFKLSTKALRETQRVRDDVLARLHPDMPHHYRSGFCDGLQLVRKGCQLALQASAKEAEEAGQLLTRGLEMLKEYSEWVADAMGIDEQPGEEGWQEES